MTGPRVLLMQLSQRTSAKGNTYLAGWLGRASVVAFQAEEPDKWGNPVWDVFVSTPEPKPEARQDGPAKPSAPPSARGDGWRGSSYRRPGVADQRRRAPAADAAPFYDDDLADIGR